MDAFLNEGGLQDDIKKQKKLEEQAAEGLLVESDEDAEKDKTEPDDKMCGYMVMEKTRLDQKQGVSLNIADVAGDIGSLGLKGLKGVMNLVPLGQKKGTFFAIKKDILYEYTSRKNGDSISQIKISKISAIEKNHLNEK
jgi:hypothetical protein